MRSLSLLMLLGACATPAPLPAPEPVEPTAPAVTTSELLAQRMTQAVEAARSNDTLTGVCEHKVFVDVKVSDVDPELAEAWTAYWTHHMPDATGTDLPARVQALKVFHTEHRQRLVDFRSAMALYGQSHPGPEAHALSAAALLVESKALTSSGACRWPKLLLLNDLIPAPLDLQAPTDCPMVTWQGTDLAACTTTQEQTLGVVGSTVAMAQRQAEQLRADHPESAWHDLLNALK